ncbi:MAG: ATP-binding cassette domain-containing protein [Gammaproteobacteria bacterium]|nr:ATP-binding cassette domain-containing protein [Gammaproteobacteria bacterium]MBL6999205.1 ATP-binding cassette domain-containing protein [Gammaproteobacteria bacterium]
MTYAVSIRSISKTFRRTRALDAVTINISAGEMVALIGPTGSGKSTLLRLIAGLEEPDKDSAAGIMLNGQSIQQKGRFSSRSSPQIRSGVGVIFQQFNLIRRMTLMQNILLGCVPRWRITLGLYRREEKNRALSALDQVGLKQLARLRASALSGEQRQRMAIARTLMQQANIVLADEPITALDKKSAKTVMRNLRRLRKQDGKTVIVSLNQLDYARKYCKRAIALVNGRVVYDGPVKQLSDDILIQLYGSKFYAEEVEDEEQLAFAQSRQKQNIALVEV